MPLSSICVLQQREDHESMSTAAASSASCTKGDKTDSTFMTKLSHGHVCVSFSVSLTPPGVREHEGQLQEASRRGARGEEHPARDGGGYVRRVPVTVLAKSTHRLWSVLGGGLLPHLRVPFQVRRWLIAAAVVVVVAAGLAGLSC